MIDINLLWRETQCDSKVKEGGTENVATAWFSNNDIDYPFVLLITQR